MAELRWHPLTKDWVMVASHRQNRPQMPKDWCPFCPGPDNDKVPKSFDVLKYDNDFPALSQNPPKMDDVATSIYKTAPSYGKCEVVLYSPEHTVTLPELPESHVRKLVDLWTERFSELSQDEKIKYIFIFENRGDVVGVQCPILTVRFTVMALFRRSLSLSFLQARSILKKQGNAFAVIC